MHAKRVCKYFKIKNFGEYHNLYLKRDALFLGTVLKTLEKCFIKFYHLDPAKLRPVPGLASQGALKTEK